MANVSNDKNEEKNFFFQQKKKENILKCSKMVQEHFVNNTFCHRNILFTKRSPQGVLIEE